MGIRAVRTQDQDVISSVMRRQIIGRVSPLVSLDINSNPLSKHTDKKRLFELLEKFGLKVREWLANLSSGEISISDFHSKTVRTLDEICRDGDADGGFLRELDKIVHDIRIEMDGTFAKVRRLMNGGPLPLNTELSYDDAALLSLIKTARKQIASAAEPDDKAPPPAEHPKSLQTIKGSNGQSVKDHPDYGPILEEFLGSRGITKKDSPQMTRFFEILADRPLGQKVDKAILIEMLGINDGAVNSLINRVKKRKLYLNSGENPTTPGIFIRMAGREDRKNKTALGHYCYELVVAVEEE